MNAQQYPSRETMRLNDNFNIVHWHNADYSENIYQLTQKETPVDEKTENTVWFVRAQFKYVGELIKYLQDFDFDGLGF